MASINWGEENFIKEAHKEDQFKGCGFTSEYHQHRSLLLVNDLLKVPKRKRSRNCLVKETDEIIKKQKLEDNKSVEESMKNNCNDESSRSYHDDNGVYQNSSRDCSDQCSNDKYSSWKRKYQALKLRMQRLSKEIDKYMQKTLRSKLKKKEISSLLIGHTPVPKKCISTTKSQPDYSGIRINELCAEILKDSRSCKPSNLYSDVDVSGISEDNSLIETITIHEPATEIFVSLNGHVPIPYKLSPITVQPPDYSGFKINKLHTDILKDPRLSKPSNLYSNIDVSGVPEYDLLTEPTLHHECETEINGSCNGHAPTQYKLIPISIPPPDYSRFKINKLHTELLKDPRSCKPSNLYSGIDVSMVTESIPQITPTPIHEPTTDINGLSNSHTPFPYSHIPLTIQPPDYSGFKINKLHTDILKDPRLSKPSKLYSSVDVTAVPESIPQITLTPVHEPTTEINGLSNTHARIPYNHIPITVPPPDYTGLKMNKQHIQILKNQRSCTPSNLCSGRVVSGVPMYFRLVKQIRLYKSAREINASLNRHAQIQFKSVQYTRILFQKSMLVKRGRTSQ